MIALTTKLRDCGSMALIERSYMDRHNLPLSSFAALTKRKESTVRNQHFCDTSMTVNELLRTRENFPNEIRQVIADIIRPTEADVMEDGAASVSMSIWDADASLTAVGRTIADAESDGVWTAGELAALARDLDGVRRRLLHIFALASMAAARSLRVNLGIGRRA